MFVTWWALSVVGGVITTKISCKSDARYRKYEDAKLKKKKSKTTCEGKNQKIKIFANL